mgnify:FL=1|jgi:toxin-antitoxin system, antitoxin component, abrB famil
MIEVSKIQKWGNSQGIRIPKKMLETLDLKVNDSISIEEGENCLKIKKVEEKLSNIEKLFLNYEDEYEKIDLDWDNEVGKEIW